MWHASPSGKSVGWTAVLLRLLLWFHPTKEHGQLQKTTCAKDIPYHLFQAKLSSPEGSTAQDLAIFKDSAPRLNYSSHLVIISLPQSTATNFALVCTVPLWTRSRIERDIFTGLPPSCPQTEIISLTSVQHKALCTIVLIAGEGKGLFKPSLQHEERTGGGEGEISNNHTIAQVHFMHTSISPHSFSILLSLTSSLWKISHPSASGFWNLCCRTLCQIPLSPIRYWVVCSSLMGIGWIPHPSQCFTLFLYQVRGLILLPSRPHAPSSHQLFQFTLFSTSPSHKA